MEIRRRNVLIVTVHEPLDAHDMRQVREEIIAQLREGVVVIPPWRTAIVADIDYIKFEDGELG